MSAKIIGVIHAKGGAGRPIAIRKKTKETQMRRNITINTLLLLSLFVTGSAWAEWKVVDETEKAFFYIDPATIRKEGNLRKVWEITDLKTRETDVAMSKRARTEYDCKNERWRLLALSTYSESMVKGKELFNMRGGPTDWSDIPPRTAVETTLKIVCAQ